MKIWLALVLTLLAAQPGRSSGESQRFTTIGSFSNMRFTEEHQYGAEIQLWKEGGELLGLFSFSEGLIGDTPTGLLEHTKYDPRTGIFSFEARLTTGQHFCTLHKDVPSRDVFSFRGKLSRGSVSGVLKRSDLLHPEAPATEERVVLRRSTGKHANQADYRSRSEWSAASGKILKLRGPKW